MGSDARRLREFAARYTEAWCSQDPAQVAAHYAPNGSLTINDERSIVGRDAITEAARAFMDAFPDMQVLMDDVRVDGPRRSTTGRSSAPTPVRAGRTRVRISGFEEWTIGDDGLIASPLGHFDQAEYDRQIRHGVES